MDTPTKLNGYEVVRVEQHANCSTVMVDKGGELVVCTWWPELGTRWQWGHYFSCRSKGWRELATEDFNETAKRNAGR